MNLIFCLLLFSYLLLSFFFYPCLLFFYPCLLFFIPINSFMSSFPSFHFIFPILIVVGISYSFLLLLNNLILFCFHVFFLPFPWLYSFFFLRSLQVIDLHFFLILKNIFETNFFFIFSYKFMSGCVDSGCVTETLTLNELCALYFYSYLRNVYIIALLSSNSLQYALKAKV